MKGTLQRDQFHAPSNVRHLLFALLAKGDNNHNSIYREGADYVKSKRNIIRNLTHSNPDDDKPP